MENGFMKSGTIDRHPPLLTRLKNDIYKRFRFVNSFGFVNGCSQSCFMFGLVSIAGWGVGVTIPMLYDAESYTGPFMRVFGCFLAFQIIVNWICIKTVDSTYKPYKHGTKPDNIKIGEILNRTGLYDHDINGTGHVESDYHYLKDGQPIRTSFPYFSWTPCLRCNRLRPPRCHHCPSCNTCVLKRDHHCFVTGVCVGYHNLRHFAVFITWASVATIFGTLHAIPYCYHEAQNVELSYFDLFFPIAIVRCILGYIRFKHAFLITVLYLLLAFCLWSVSFFGKFYTIVRTGVTSFEEDSNFMMYDVRPLHKRLEAVFGQYWWLNFLVPMHFVFQPLDDPISWPYMRA